MEIKVTHRPKGRMCVACQAKLCPKPSEFPHMRVIGQDDDGVKVVLCTNFESAKVSED